MLVCQNWAQVNLGIILILISFIFITLHFLVIPIILINMSFIFIILNHYIVWDGTLQVLPLAPEDSQAPLLLEHHQVHAACLKAQI